VTWGFWSPTYRSRGSVLFTAWTFQPSKTRPQQSLARLETNLPHDMLSYSKWRASSKLACLLLSLLCS